MQRAEVALYGKIAPILRKVALSVAAQAKAHFSKIRKSDDDDSDDFADTVDLGGFDLLVNAVPAELESVMKDSGRQALMQLGIEHESNLVNQVDLDSLDFAVKRGAEMVGKKWVDGELVDNPNADWVISDATRDEIRNLVADVQSGDLKLTDLADAIMNSTGFSPERAQLIARTEIMNANAQGSLASYKAAAKIGVNIKKAWEPDESACEICQANAAQGAIPVDDDFDSDDDSPPAHPNCECVLVPVIDDDAEDDN